MRLPGLAVKTAPDSVVTSLEMSQGPDRVASVYVVSILTGPNNVTAGKNLSHSDPRTTAFLAKDLLGS